MGTPVLCVHGLHDRGVVFRRVRRALEARGVTVETIDLPSSGRLPVAELARLVVGAGEALKQRTGAEKIDLVGFSMGALASRFAVQRLGAAAWVRRFISISGPHAGTWTAYLLGFAGVRDMRPNSALLMDLAKDKDPWGAVEVHAFWTPYDLMILPARSSQLRGVRSERTFPVALHPLMLWNKRVIAAVVEVLTAADAAPSHVGEVVSGVVRSGRR